jgi:hypothetical protein
MILWEKAKVAFDLNRVIRRRSGGGITAKSTWMLILGRMAQDEAITSGRGPASQVDCEFR